MRPGWSSRVRPQCGARRRLADAVPEWSPSDYVLVCRRGRWHRGAHTGIGLFGTVRWPRRRRRARPVVTAAVVILACWSLAVVFVLSATWPYGDPQPRPSTTYDLELDEP